MDRMSFVIVGLCKWHIRSSKEGKTYKQTSLWFGYCPLKVFKILQLFSPKTVQLKSFQNLKNRAVISFILSNKNHHINTN